MPDLYISSANCGEFKIQEHWRVFLISKNFRSIGNIAALFVWWRKTLLTCFGSIVRRAALSRCILISTNRKFYFIRIFACENRSAIMFLHRFTQLTNTVSLRLLYSTFVFEEKWQSGLPDNLSLHFRARRQILTLEKAKVADSAKTYRFSPSGFTLFISTVEIQPVITFFRSFGHIWIGAQIVNYAALSAPDCALKWVVRSFPQCNCAQSLFFTQGAVPKPEKPETQFFFIESCSISKIIFQG